MRDLTGTGEVTKRRVREGTGEFPIDCPLEDNTVRVHFKTLHPTTNQVKIHSNSDQILNRLHFFVPSFGQNSCPNLAKKVEGSQRICKLEKLSSYLSLEFLYHESCQSETILSICLKHQTKMCFRPNQEVSDCHCRDSNLIHTSSYREYLVPTLKRNNLKRSA